jgi:hypothetical protein
MTTEEERARNLAAARARYEVPWWESKDLAYAALCQLQEPILIMPFEDFHRGTELLLGHSVWSHEFADPEALIQEAMGLKERPDMAAILAKLPQRLRDGLIVIVAEDTKGAGDE